ncbi:hypothetical protein RND81_04G005400 [Saponaria officinalis]|uniref:Uncharacterized protein n=1 Tax=Saponaria officinalis TaxID=3572 RepID=A0AAW1LE31_SAPOF
MEETQQMTTTVHQQHQRLQAMQQHAEMQRRSVNHPSLGGPVNGIMDNRMALLKSAGNQQGQLGQGNSGSTFASLHQIQTQQTTTSVHLMQLLQFQVMQRHAETQRRSVNDPLLGGPVNGIMDNRMTLRKSADNQQGQLGQGNSGSTSVSSQQIQAQPYTNSEIKSEVNVGSAQKSLSMNPSSVYGQAIVQIDTVDSSPSINSHPLKGCPLADDLEQFADVSLDDSVSSHHATPDLYGTLNK